MHAVSRIPMSIAALFSGAAAVFGLLIALYTYSNTPELHEIVVQSGSNKVHTESKGWYLFQVEIPLVFLFFMTFYPAVNWRAFVVRKQRTYERFATQFRFLEQLDLNFLFILICILICVFSSINFWDLIVRSRVVWNSAMPS